MVVQVVDGAAIGESLGCLCEIINDFVAQGYGILTLGDDDVVSLHKATPVDGAPIACLGAGTCKQHCMGAMSCVLQALG